MQGSRDNVGGVPTYGGEERMLGLHVNHEAGK